MQDEICPLLTLCRGVSKGILLVDDIDVRPSRDQLTVERIYIYDVVLRIADLFVRGFAACISTEWRTSLHITRPADSARVGHRARCALQ